MRTKIRIGIISVIVGISLLTIFLSNQNVKKEEKQGNKNFQKSENVILMPNQKEYRYGDEINLEGAKIQIEDEEIEVTEDMFPNFQTDKIGTSQAILVYNGKELGKYEYQVNDYVVDMKMLELPKTSYQYGEELDLTGAKIQKTYASGKEEDSASITYEMVDFEKYNATQLGDQIIPVFCDEKEINFIVSVEDTKGPEILLNGEEMIELQVGENYEEQGYEVSDNVDKEVNLTCFVDASMIDTEKIGEYQVIYTATDSRENTTIKERTIKVVDKTVPQITLESEEVFEIGLGEEFIIPKATAYDLYDGDLTEEIQITNPVNTKELGEYILAYSVADYSGNQSETITRKVIVKDIKGPEIRLLGDNPYHLEIGNSYEEPGAKIVDDVDQNLDYMVDMSDAKLDTFGTYEITYRAEDRSQNKAETVTRTVIVEDTIKPEIVLSEENVYRIKVGEELPEFKAEATDNYDGQVEVEIKHKIKEDTIGVYELCFIAKDSSGNTKEIKKKFEVYDDEKPQIEIKGKNPIVLVVGTEFEEPEIEVSDNYSHAENLKVEITNSVNSKKAGEYELIYSVTDEAGNQETKTRKVYVLNEKQIQALSQRVSKLLENEKASSFAITLKEKQGKTMEELKKLLDEIQEKVDLFEKDLWMKQ